MRYLLAIILPPVAVLLCGKPVQFLLNILLTCLFWIPGVIHAILVVNSHLADQRTARLEKAIRESKAGS
ncbi:YqaE/Pmp3 family membrane protein [Castellaniella sp.]|uniref:YqaE/Pmp3 family membrane protein n=1 Tax=Castellaniella sp. TaxID=1955812 RepID=UPI003C758DB3